MTIALACALQGRLQGQISPGPLAKAHRDLEGPTQCSACHGLRREPMSTLCLGCHRDVQWLIDQRRGLHAREVTDGHKECASCHPDHAGVSFALVAWPEGAPSRFDHRRAGWSLDDRHAPVKCERCHAEAFRVSPVVALAKRKSGTGWLGLETACASCHREDDPHKGSLGPKCESCHDVKGWKPASKFDHARTDYPLTGKHADVACDKCHLATRLGVKPDAKGVRIPVFKPVPFPECSSCHDDPHRGRLSAKCADCHVTRGFSIVDRREFNHSLTRYPLDGKHRAVTCDACHGSNMARPNPPFASCGSCHADAHRGEATLAGAASDCAACHTVRGFAPSTFTVSRHQSTRFALGGKHRDVPCASCHTPVAAAGASGAGASASGTHMAKVVRIRVPFARCADCHADAHGGQLAARTDKGSCEACHSDSGWKPSTYALAAHAALRLPLDGRHLTVACAACHAATRPGLRPLPTTMTLGTAKVALVVPETACSACHVDPHAGRYATGGAVPTANGCRNCHDTRSFRPATTGVAMHATFSFALEGAHRAAPCVSCHAEMRSNAATSSLVESARGVASLPFTSRRAANCASCHESPHGDQFAARKDRGACESCHAVDTFAPATRFNHDRDAAFSLAGAHARVPCTGCHRAPAPSGDRRSIVYRGLATRCESCHAGRPGTGHG
ncbi:MAG: hypothetical protein ACHQQ3_01570 [Gemmatimonadales bacterium]